MAKARSCREGLSPLNAAFFIPFCYMAEGIFSLKGDGMGDVSCTIDGTNCCDCGKCTTTIRIKIQKAPRAIWHIGCGHRTGTGIMKVLQHYTEYSSVICLDCGKEAKIPTGAGFDSCFDVEEVKKCAVCFPGHCTDTTHGECWCGPTQEDGLIIHQQPS